MDGNMGVYIVSSFRDYGEDEQYFSADSVHHTREEADRAIKDDIALTLDDYEELHDDDGIRSQEIEEDDVADYKIEYGGVTFMWRIDFHTFN